jgi:hypothetical protein
VALSVESAASTAAGNLLSGTTPADLARWLCRAEPPLCPSVAHVSEMRVVAAAQAEPGGLWKPVHIQ